MVDCVQLVQWNSIEPVVSHTDEYTDVENGLLKETLRGCLQFREGSMPQYQRTIGKRFPTIF